MFSFTTTLLGIDLHDHLVQFVELSKWGRKVALEAYNRTTIPEGFIEDGEVKKEEELKELLRKLLSEANPRPTKVKDFALILPTKVTFIHIFNFPSKLSKQDLNKLIPVEVENILPYSINEVYWDFTVIDKQKQEGQTVLFAATPKKIADQYLKIFTEVGLTPRLFGIQPEALQNALAYKLPPQKNILIVELGALASNYLFLKGENIQKFVSINGGIEALIQDLSKNFEMPIEELWANWEIHKTEQRFQAPLRKFIEQEYEKARRVMRETAASSTKEATTLLLTGEFSNLPLFYEQARAFFADKEVMIGDPKSSLLIEDAKFASNIEKLGGKVPYSIYFTDAIGITIRAFGGTGQGINLIPDSLKAQFSARQLAMILGASSILMTTATGLLAGAVAYNNSILSYNRLRLEIERSGLEKTLFGTRYQEIKDELILFNQEVSVLGRIDQTLISVPSVLSDVMELIPADIEVRHIHYFDSDLSVQITGVANGRESLLQLQENLEANPMVKDFKIPLSSYDQKSKTSFTVTLSLDFTQLPPYAASSVQ